MHGQVTKDLEAIKKALQPIVDNYAKKVTFIEVAMRAAFPDSTSQDVLDKLLSNKKVVNAFSTLLEGDNAIRLGDLSRAIRNSYLAKTDNQRIALVENLALFAKAKGLDHLIKSLKNNTDKVLGNYYELEVALDLTDGKPTKTAKITFGVPVVLPSGSEAYPSDIDVVYGGVVGYSVKLTESAFRNFGPKKFEEYIPAARKKLKADFGGVPLKAVKPSTVDVPPNIKKVFQDATPELIVDNIDSNGLKG